MMEMIDLKDFPAEVVQKVVSACRVVDALCVGFCREVRTDLRTGKSETIRTVVPYKSTRGFGDYPPFEILAWLKEPSASDRRLVARYVSGIELRAWESDVSDHDEGFEHTVTGAP